MNKKIIYQRADNSIGIHTFVKQGLSTNELIKLAERGTPSDLPFWIVNEDTIPTDKTNRNAWELDSNQGDPDGIGKGGQNAILPEDII